MELELAGKVALVNPGASRGIRRGRLPEGLARRRRENCGDRGVRGRKALGGGQTQHLKASGAEVLAVPTRCLREGCRGRSTVKQAPRALRTIDNSDQQRFEALGSSVETRASLDAKPQMWM